MGTQHTEFCEQSAVMLCTCWALTTMYAQNDVTCCSLSDCRNL